MWSELGSNKDKNSLYLSNISNIIELFVFKGSGFMIASFSAYDSTALFSSSTKVSSGR